MTKICSGCQEKIKIFDELQTKANSIKNELIGLYESSENFHEIEAMELENVDFTFKPIELEIITESANNEESKTEDLSDDFKKIIEEKGIKYDYSVFQRVFGADEVDIDVQKQRRKFYCDECKIEIKNFNNFLIHKADHEKQNYQIANPNDENQPDEKFNCFCGKIFLYKLSYTQHLKIHNNIREYHCNYELCDFKAFNSTHLQRHIRARHTKEKKHTCVYCGRKFGEKYNMNSHIRKQHMNNRKYDVEAVY